MDQTKNLKSFSGAITVVRNSTANDGMLLIGVQGDDKGHNLICFDIDKNKVAKGYLKMPFDFIADLTQEKNAGKILAAFSTMGSPIFLIDDSSEILLGNLPSDTQFICFVVLDKMIHVMHSQGVMAFDMNTNLTTAISPAISALLREHYYPVAHLVLECNPILVLFYEEEYYLNLHDKKISLNVSGKKLRPHSFVSGEKILAAIEDGPNGVYLWNTQGERVLTELFNEHTLTISSICISNDDKYIAIGMMSGYLLVYEIASAEQVFSKRIHTSRISAICEWKDGFITGGYDGKLLFVQIAD